MFVVIEKTFLWMGIQKSDLRESQVNFQFVVLEDSEKDIDLYIGRFFLSVWYFLWFRHLTVEVVFIGCKKFGLFNYYYILFI